MWFTDGSHKHSSSTTGLQLSVDSLSLSLSLSLLRLHRHPLPLSRCNQLQTSKDILLKRVSQTGAWIKTNWEKEEVKQIPGGSLGGMSPQYVSTWRETDILTISHMHLSHTIRMRKS